MPDTGYTICGIRYLVSGIWYLVSGILHPVSSLFVLLTLLLLAVMFTNL